jgi:hypothetical protein
MQKAPPPFGRERSGCSVVAAANRLQLLQGRYGLRFLFRAFPHRGFISGRRLATLPF